MEAWNGSEVTGFSLTGFMVLPPLQSLLFAAFLFIYLLALSGNVTILTAIFIEPHLHTPMYLFLSNLSILDITFISTVLPKLLDILLSGSHKITYLGCFTQISFFLICVASEYCLLAVMAFDRYVAICHPLRYTAIMSLKVCAILAMVPWLCGLLDAFICLSLLTQYSFCHTNVINHLFCDMKTLLKLSCSNTKSIELAIQVSGTLFGFTPLLLIIMSYVLIAAAVLKIRSTKGKSKAFSTCSSHITVVTLFFGIILGIYMRPKSVYSIEQDKVFSILYTSCIPTLNPLIYSLRNQTVKLALRNLKHRF